MERDVEQRLRSEEPDRNGSIRADEEEHVELRTTSTRNIARAPLPDDLEPKV